MKKILFFETPVFTGATRVTRTMAKILQNKHEVFFAVVAQSNLVQTKINQEIDRLSPDILFSSFVCINPDVIEVGKSRGLRVVVRNDYKIVDIKETQRNRLFSTYPLADCIIAQTCEMREELLGVPGVSSYQIKVIDNPLDQEYILEKASALNPFPKNGKFHFLWVGRKDPIKDITTLQKAFEIVHKQFPETDLTIISGEPNPYKWIKNADCLVISSISEASPNVLREALFLGINVISTDCSTTVRDLLPPERICPVKDVRTMSRLMIEVIINTQV